MPAPACRYEAERRHSTPIALHAPTLFHVKPPRACSNALVPCIMQPRRQNPLSQSQTDAEGANGPRLAVPVYMAGATVYMALKGGRRHSSAFSSPGSSLTRTVATRHEPRLRSGHHSQDDRDAVAGGGGSSPHPHHPPHSHGAELDARGVPVINRRCPHINTGQDSLGPR